MVTIRLLRQVFAQSLRRVPDTDHNGRPNFLLPTKDRHGLIHAPIDTDVRFLRLEQVLAIMHIEDCIPVSIVFIVIRRQPDFDIAGIEIDKPGRHTRKMMEGADQIGVFNRTESRLDFLFTSRTIADRFAAGRDIVKGVKIHHMRSQIQSSPFTGSSFRVTFVEISGEPRTSEP